MSPGHSDVSYFFPCVWINLCFLHVSLANILEAELWMANRAGSLAKLSIEHVFWDVAIVHATHMPKPAETPLHEQHEHAWNASSLKNLSIGYSVLPLDVQEASETAEMEAVEPLLLPGVGCPALAAVQKSA